jgi:hypothetical protein
MSWAIPSLHLACISKYIKYQDYDRISSQQDWIWQDVPVNEGSEYLSKPFSPSKLVKIVKEAYRH